MAEGGCGRHSDCVAIYLSVRSDLFKPFIRDILILLQGEQRHSMEFLQEHGT